MLTKNKRSRTDGSLSEMFGGLVHDMGRFYILESLDSTKKLSSLNPFVIKKSIENISGEIDICKTKKRRDGTIVLKAKNEIGNQFICGIKNFGEVEVSVKDFVALNSSQGIIYCPELIETSCNEIIEGLSSQGVTNAYKINKKGSSSSTPLIILTFNNRIQPASIVVGYTIIEVRRYIQNPMRCVNCQKFGHTKKYCKESAVCEKCSIPEKDHKECEEINCLICVEVALRDAKHYMCGPIKCVNCHEAHSSSDHICPIFKREFEINKLKIERSLTYFEAKKLFDQTNSSEFSGLFANNPMTGNNNINELNSIVANLSKKLDTEIKVNKDREVRYQAFIKRQEEMIINLESVIKSKDLLINKLIEKVSKYKGEKKILANHIREMNGDVVQFNSSGESDNEGNEEDFVSDIDEGDEEMVLESEVESNMVLSSLSDPNQDA